MAALSLFEQNWFNPGKEPERDFEFMSDTWTSLSFYELAPGVIDCQDIF
jgi:hypothetical protein